MFSSAGEEVQGWRSSPSSRVTLMQISDQGEMHDWPLLSEIVIAWFYQIQGTQPQHQGTWTRYIVTPILFRKLVFQAILLFFTNHQIEPKWQSRISRNLPNTFFKSFQSNSIFTDSPKSRSVPHIIYLTIFRCSSPTHSVSRSGLGLKLGAGWLGPVLKSPPHVHFR